MANIQQAIKTTKAQAQSQLTQEKIEEWVRSVHHDADAARAKTAGGVNDAAQQKTGERVPFIVDEDAEIGKGGSNK